MSANSSRARNEVDTKPSQRFGTPIIECPREGDMRKYASAEERVAKKQKTTVRHFGFMEKVYGLSCTVTAAMPKWWTALWRTTKDAKHSRQWNALSKTYERSPHLWWQCNGLQWRFSSCANEVDACLKASKLWEHV